MTVVEYDSLYLNNILTWTPFWQFETVHVSFKVKNWKLLGIGFLKYLVKNAFSWVYITNQSVEEVNLSICHHIELTNIWYWLF